MIANETMTDENGYQVALFPLERFSISQPWWGNYSHEGGSTYYANDILGYDSNGNYASRQPCYAPVDIQLLWKDATECVALWQSIEPVHFADDSIEYLGIICYHDNDIQNGTYSVVGTIKRQGEIFNRTGTGGFASGDHVHLETGKGQVNLATDYLYHFRDNTSCKRITPDKALFINDTTIIPSQHDSGYNWVEYEELPSELKRRGIYGVYYGNIYTTSQALTMQQMKVNARYLYRALTNKGWTLNAIAGLLGNLQSESSINPRSLGK